MDEQKIPSRSERHKKKKGGLFSICVNASSLSIQSIPTPKIFNRSAIVSSPSKIVVFTLFTAPWNPPVPQESHRLLHWQFPQAPVLRAAFCPQFPQSRPYPVLHN